MVLHIFCRENNVSTASHPILEKEKCWVYALKKIWILISNYVFCYMGSALNPLLPGASVRNLYL